MLYKILKFIIKPLFKIFLLYKVENKPKKMSQKKLIICANHISLLDPILLAVTTDREISYMAKKELYNNKILAFLLKKLYAFPVDRGNNDIDAVRQSIKILKEDKLLGIFPEGTRIKNNTNRSNFKDGVAMIATRTNSDILPVHIEGKYGLFSRIKVKYKDIINIDNYDKNDKKNIYKNIMDDVYNSIFNENI